MVLVRLMTEADIPAVSAIRVTGWQAAYRGLIPQRYLDGMTAEGDAERRRATSASRAGYRPSWWRPGRRGRGGRLGPYRGGDGDEPGMG